MAGFSPHAYLSVNEEKNLQKKNLPALILMCVCAFYHSGNTMILWSILYSLFSAKVSLLKCSCILVEKIVTETSIQSSQSLAAGIL